MFFSHWEAVFLCKAAFQLVSPSRCWWMGFFITQVQTFAFPLLNFSVLVFSVLQLVNVPLRGDTTIWSTNHFSQFCILSKLTRVAHYSVMEKIKTNQKFQLLQCLEYCFVVKRGELDSVILGM